MRKAIRTSIIVGCLGMIFAGISVTASLAQTPIREVLNRMDTYNKSLQSLQADVTMVKYDSALKLSETFSGSVSYLPKAKGHDRYARLDWTKPEQSSLAVIGNDFELYKASINQVFYGKATGNKSPGKSGNFIALLTMSKDELGSNFTPAYVAQEEIQGGISTWHIELTPKTTQDYKQADLWIDGDGTPRQVRILEKNNDTTTILIFGIKKNPTIKGSTFKLSYPSNAKKVPA